MIRVRVESDSPLVRAGLESLLRADPEIDLVHSGEDPDVVVSDAARGMLARELSPAELAGAVKTAASGLVVTAQAAAADGVLTGREVEVLRLLASGVANKNIAWQLGISEHTAKFHVASVLAKLQAASRAEAVAIGIRRGLIPI